MSDDDFLRVETGLEPRDERLPDVLLRGPGRVAVPDRPGQGGRPVPHCGSGSCRIWRRPGSAWAVLPLPPAAGTVPAGHVRIGYARASTVRQSLDTQADSLRAAGLTRIFAEKISTRAVTRPELDRAVALAREMRTSGVAVTIVVHEHKRLGRGIELAALAEQLRALFVTAVGTVEPLASRLVRLLMYHQAGPTRSLISRRAACLGPPTKWRETLEAQGVGMIGDLVDWVALGRLWEDRSVIVHRGSVVDARHSTVSSAEPGAVLLPSPEASGKVPAWLSRVIWSTGWRRWRTRSVP